MAKLAWRVLVVAVVLALVHMVWQSLRQEGAFFGIAQIEPALLDIHRLGFAGIQAEALQAENWHAWPERGLYTPGTKWDIVPFFGFGAWSERACRQCPNIAAFLKGIPGLRVAILSRLADGSVLDTHTGWAEHANHVVRCHFGIKVPPRCFAVVHRRGAQVLRMHRERQWLAFDDSKPHYACNLCGTGEDRVVLIVDIVRPWALKRGTSTFAYSEEMVKFVEDIRKYDTEG